ncbi:MAG: RecQ family ATP-dependent DNA helicase [Bacteroidetes bacterium]|nr:RecQ family ATP-dependent DNA helicase [Bacteroidota bacterium]HET6243918.1 ATP-dependent DNA helicase RecQ [Bacteroidia bacterium]
MNFSHILEKYWGYKQFRPLQQEIISSIAQGNDTLALLPTGGGKSICFQVPALALEGVCIVISPLIALMKDQVENLNKRGIKAVAITSSMKKQEIDITLDNCIHGNIKFLYLSPERLGNDVFEARLKQMKVSFIAVDESHCISQWGYDFRPAYLKIAAIREILPNKAIIALTATATPEVVKDIQDKLVFKKPQVFQKSFERTNLSYIVQKEEDKLKRLLKIISSIPGTGIVYVRNRKKTKEVVSFLVKNNINADYYHAGLDANTRDAKQENWMNNKNKIIVATNAFGMGIDKPDVRFVVHLDIPDTLEAYFQEAGRGGRDEKKAYAALLYNQSDISDLLRNVESSFPSIEDIKKTYHALGNYFQIATGGGQGSSFDFEIADFSANYNLNLMMVYNAVKILEKEGYISVTEVFYQPSRIHFIVNNNDLYKFQVSNVNYDDFIKLLLRSYSGCFENFVKINESDLSKRAGISREKIIMNLKMLDKYKLLSYQPQIKLPQLMFTSDRVDVKSFYLSKENYFERKKRALEKMNSVLHYLQSNHKCRSQLLLAYFGENNFNTCGVCDICLTNKNGVSSDEFQNISNCIENTLKKSPLSLVALVDSFKDIKEDKILKAIQWLMDNNKIKDKENLLHWVN